MQPLCQESGTNCSRLRNARSGRRRCSAAPASGFEAGGGRLLSVVAYRLLFFCCGFGAAWLTGRLIRDEIAYERKVREQMRRLEEPPVERAGEAKD